MRCTMFRTCQLYTHLYLYTYETVLCMLYHAYDYTIYLDYWNSGTCSIMGLQRCVAGRIYRIRLLPHSRYTNSGIIMLTITSSLVENITSSSMFTTHIQVNTLVHSMQHKVINNSCYYCLAKSSLLTQLSPHYSDEQSSFSNKLCIWHSVQPSSLSG